MILVLFSVFPSGIPRGCMDKRKYPYIIAFFSNYVHYCNEIEKYYGEMFTVAPPYIR